MSTLSYEQVAILVRRRTGGREEERLRYVPLVDEGLRRLAYRVARDSRLRNYLLTDPVTTTATLDGNGVADLSTLLTTPRILLECLEYGQINHSSSSYQFQWRQSSEQGNLRGAADSLWLRCWLVGTKLYTKGLGNSVLTGSISLAVAYVPTLAQLPELLVEMLVDEIVGLLSSEGGQEYEEAAA